MDIMNKIIIIILFNR